MDNREWRLKSNYVERHEYSMYCCPAVTFIQLSITVNIERKSSSHTAAVTVVGLGKLFLLLSRMPRLNSLKDARLVMTAT